MKMNNKNSKPVFEGQCDMCAYFDYDEDFEQYICTINMDEDDAVRFYESRKGCPYFRFYDEYKIVRKQN